ncbi:hypothetical protein I4U23_015118 [Adineta vaga]|nr:hypothetical protein I4U23_015118 [Adineta vaga]
MTLTFESLPNEIWLIIFSYLSSRHTWRAFFGINRRLTQLLSSNLIRHTIDLKDISYPEIVQLLENHDKKSHDYLWQTEFVSHAHAICLENDLDYEILINRWIATKPNWKLSSLRTIYILPGAINKIGILYYELEFVQILQSQLHYLHLIFEQPCSTYHSTLSHLVEKRISCPVMILQVTRGHTYQHLEYADLYNIEHSLYWMRTVCLTISLQHSSELILLLMPEALPLLEHLNVTIEQPRKDLITKRKQQTKSIQLSEKDLRDTNAAGTKLRSFVLRQMELQDLLTLFNILTFPLLETLILVDIFDKSLNNLLAFQQLIGPSNLPSLKRNQFQFLLQFPAKCEHEWIQRYSNNGWPFNNVGFHVDERIEDQFDYSPLSDIIEDNQVEIVVTPTHANHLCHYLRSLTFRLTHVSRVCSMHHSLLQLILDTSPHLFYLNARWIDLSHCSGRYPMIRHVHIIHGGDGAHFDVIQFNMIIPKVHYLSIRGQRQLVREKEMVNFVCELLIDKAQLSELLFLQINKNGNYILKPGVKENTKQAIIANIDRLKDLTTTQIEFSYHNQLSIWLC